MAILEHEVVESTSGFAKEIEESALTMIFDNLQKSQYHHPIKSTVREIACNSLDAVKERDAVKEILKGNAKEEDYFIRRNEAIYKDSNFNKDYYDLKWLGNEKNVIITYFSKETDGGKDYISFKDYGVGLGGKRLEGYMKLGYSSKRNSKLNIGKFGIGAKAPLSTYVDSFRCITAHNGKKFTFDIYSHKVDSATPKLNLETGKKNKGYTFANGYVAYYEETTEKNFTEIRVETKKHHKQQYVDAIKSQLLYLKGIKFYVNTYGDDTEYDISSEIMYEDDKIILAENRQYSKPHIVIDGVTYGYIDFLELELENKIGNVGIKVNPDEVTVTPSRETVVWNEKTRETVVNRFNEVVDIASAFVEAELKEVDFLKWIKACTTTLTHTNRNSTLGRLSTLIDKSQITPAYPLEKSIKYKGFEKFFAGFRIRNIIKSYDMSVGKQRVKRGENITSWSSADLAHAYIQSGDTKHQKDLYLYSIGNDDGGWGTDQNITIIEPQELPEDTKLNDKQKAKYLKYQETLLKLLIKSGVTSYEEVAVPDDWKTKLDNMEEAEVKGEDYGAPKLTPAEQRELNQETVYKSPSREYYSDDITFKIGEWKIASIKSIDDNPSIDKLIYGFGNDRDGLEFIYNFVNHNKNYKNSVQIISISKQNEKYYRDLKKGIYIKDLFKQIDVKKKTIAVDPLIIAYNTTRLIKEESSKLTFLSNYAMIDEDISEKYIALRSYLMQNRAAPFTSKIEEELDLFLNKLVEFQLFVKEVEGNDKMVSTKSEELFGSSSFKDSNVIDMDIYELYKELLAYAEPIHTMLNQIIPLTDATNVVNEELETEIRNYVAHKLNLE